MIGFLLRRLMLVAPALLGLLVVDVPAHSHRAVRSGRGAGRRECDGRADRGDQETLGLDRPIYEQFWIYLTQVVRGDFGMSLVFEPAGRRRHRAAPAGDDRTDARRLVFATVVGHHARRRRRGVPQFNCRLSAARVSVGGLALACFWVAIMLQMLLLDGAGLAAPARSAARRPYSSRRFVTGLYLVDRLLAGRLTCFVEALQPPRPAGLHPFAGRARRDRPFHPLRRDRDMQHDSSAYERAVGYPQRRIIMPYVLRNSLITPITQVGLHVRQPDRRRGGDRGDLRLARRLASISSRRSSRPTTRPFSPSRW